MAEDFEKDKINPSHSDMSFDDEENKVENLGFPDRQQKENPFEAKSNNPFTNTEAEGAESKPKIEYKIRNEKTDANKAQAQGLTKILLVLLLTTGILITAIWGMFQNKFKLGGKNNSSETAQLQTANEPEKSAAEINGPFAPKDKYCKIDEAQKYISLSMDDLDRVVSLVEGKIESLDQVPQSEKQKQIPFLKNKLEELSRAEGEIRSFSEPYLEKDVAVSFREEGTLCKVKDGPKYLNAWIDEIKERINSANAELDYFGSSEAKNTSSLASSETPNSQINTSVKPEGKPKILGNTNTTKTNKRSVTNTNKTQSSKASLLSKVVSGKNKAADKSKSPTISNSSNQSSLSLSSKDKSPQDNTINNQNNTSQLGEARLKDHTIQNQISDSETSLKQAGKRHQHIERCTSNNYYEDDYYEGGQQDYCEDDYYYQPTRCRSNYY